MSYFHQLTVEKVRTNCIEHCDDHYVYPNSKFCQIAVAKTFQEKLEKYNITSKCFHPFFANTGIFSLKHADWIETTMSLSSKILSKIVGIVSNSLMILLLENNREQSYFIIVYRVFQKSIYFCDRKSS